MSSQGDGVVGSRRELAAERRSENVFLPSIQFGRGIAALLVLLYHVTNAVFANEPSKIVYGGAAGVDIFFVISGFIITYVAQGQSARQFFAKRLVRIVPLYYFYTTIVVAILILAPTLYANLRFSWSFVVASYLFILSPSNVGSPGVAVGVGWTLCFEAYFYVLMTIGILLAGARGWLLAAAVILLGAEASLFVHPPIPLIPLMTALPLEFLAGVLLARAYMRGWVLSLPTGAVAIVIGLFSVVALGSAITISGDLYDPSRVLWYGVPATLFVAGLLAIHGHIGIARPLLWLGDVSYSLYLCHAFVIEAMVRVMRPLTASPLVMIPVLVATALVAGGISYRLIERPCTRFLSRALAVRNPLPAAREANSAARDAR